MKLNQLTAAQRGRKAKNEEENAPESVWENESQKEHVLSIVLHTLELDLARLWKLDVPEEDFVNLFAKVCMSLFYCSFTVDLLLNT